VSGKARRRSRSRFGWVTFGVGLTVCVAAGVAVGVLLGKSSGDDDGGELQRAAALALNTDRLNDDALTLSAAIEDAIAQEALESEAASLRSELAALELRAERIRASADAQLARGGSTRRTVSRSRYVATATARRSVRKIYATVAVFERELVPELGSVLSTPPDTGDLSGDVDSSTEIVAGVTEALEEQGKTLEGVTDKLAAANQRTESTAGGEQALDKPDDLISGRFDVVFEFSESELAIDYELHGFDAQVEGRETAVEASVTGSASGKLTVTNTGAAYAEGDLPAFGVVLYWDEDDVPVAVRGAEIEAVPNGGTEGVPTTEEAPTAAPASCPFELEGNRYCALMRLSFAAEAGSEGSTSFDLAQGESLTFDSLEPDGSLPVDGQEANLVAESLGAHPPSLVQILEVATVAQLRPACVVDEVVASEGEISDTEGTTVGLLSDDGTVFFEAGQPEVSAEAYAGEEYPQPPDCWDGSIHT